MPKVIAHTLTIILIYMKQDLFIIADPADNTITLSPDLTNELQIAKGDPRILLFKIKNTQQYAFVRVPVNFANTTICGIVSYNPVLHSWGFVSHCPTVQRIFYDTNIPLKQTTLKVEKQTLPDNTIIFKIINP